MILLERRGICVVYTVENMANIRMWFTYLEDGKIVFIIFVIKATKYKHCRNLFGCQVMSVMK